MVGLISIEFRSFTKKFLGGNEFPKKRATETFSFKIKFFGKWLRSTGLRIYALLAQQVVATVC